METRTGARKAPEEPPNFVVGALARRESLGAPRPSKGPSWAPEFGGGAREGGRESPFVFTGKVRPRKLRLRLRAGGWGCWGGNICSTLMRGEAAAAARGR